MTGKPEPSLAQFAVVVLAVWLPFSHVLDGLQPSSSVWRFRLRPVWRVRLRLACVVLMTLAVWRLRLRLAIVAWWLRLRLAIVAPWWVLRLRLGRLGARTEKLSTGRNAGAELDVPLPVVWRSS